VPERITRPLRKVLEVFMRDLSAELYGLDLIDATKLKSGTLYPLLHRLVNEGWLERYGPVPSDAGGPPRYFYKLTGVGQQAAARVLAEQDTSSLATARPHRPGIQPA
jgi:PadR family transcriptional regulator PadR